MKSAYISQSPYTGKLSAQYKAISAQEVERLIKSSLAAFNIFQTCPLTSRIARLKTVAHELKKRKPTLSKTITNEMGKPIKQAEAEVDKCHDMCLYHAEEAERIMAEKTIQTATTQYTITPEALGPVLFISTWNNPLLQATLALVPQIVAGNTVLVKPAPNAPQCVLAIADIVKTAYPDAPIYIPVLSAIPETEAILKDARVKGVTFIGSSNAGKRVAQLAAQSFKASVIDAGGSDPFIVLADADINAAVSCAIKGRFSNTGQSCVAAKRIIIHEECYDAFKTRFLKAAKQLKLGNPMDPDTDVGPLALHRFRDEIKQHIDTSITQGATLLMGGSIPQSDAALLDITVLGNVTPNMPVATEEIFGPVAVLMTAKNNTDAIQLANATEFGLGASLFTQTNTHLAKDIHSGNVAINTTVSTAFPIPFRGIKDSGFGVYFGDEGVHTFTNQKVISQTL